MLATTGLVCMPTVESRGNAGQGVESVAGSAAFIELRDDWVVPVRSASSRGSKRPRYAGRRGAIRGPALFDPATVSESGPGALVQPHRPTFIAMLDKA